MARYDTEEDYYASHENEDEDRDTTAVVCYNPGGPRSISRTVCLRLDNDDDEERMRRWDNLWRDGMLLDKVVLVVDTADLDRPEMWEN